MSIWSVNWAYGQHPERSGAKFTLVTLAQFADARGFCFPGQVKLGRLMDMGERTVRGHLDELERQGLIRSEVRRRDNGSRTSNGYWLLGPPEAFTGPDQDAPVEQPADSAGSPQAADLAGSADQGMSDSSYRQISPPAGSAGPEYKAIEVEPKTKKNLSTPPKAARVAKKAEERPDIAALCRRLADRIIANGANRRKYDAKAVSLCWLDDMRRLVDIELAVDQHGNPVSPAGRLLKAERAIDFCQSDSFWKGVVFSPANLRDNIDQLRVKATEQQQNGNGHRVSNGQPERRGPTVPEADLSQLPPTDPEKLREWYDRQLEGIPT